MPPLADYERLSEGQIQNLVAPSSNAVTGRERMPTVCLRSERWYTHGVSKLSFTGLVASLTHFLRQNQRAE